VNESAFPDILVVDDEPHVVRLINTILCRHFNYTKGAHAVQTVDEAVQHINTCKTDIVLLDIELRCHSGFELLDKVKPRIFEFICLSASKEYAYKVFEYGGAGYLLKPVNPNELIIVLNRILAKRISM